MKTTSIAPGIGSANQKGLSTGLYTTSPERAVCQQEAFIIRADGRSFQGGWLNHSAVLIIGSTGSFIKLLGKQAYTGPQSSAIFGSGRQASAKQGIQTAEGEPYSRSLNNLTITDKGSCQGCKAAPAIKKCGV